MKYLLITALLFFTLAPRASAQKIYFSDTTNLWKCIWYSVVQNAPVLTSDYSFHYGKDTTMGGLHYHTLGPGSTRLAGIREDTTQKKVYCRFMNGFSSTDTNEHVLYDYNLRTGDTFKIAYDTYSYSAVVVSIDSAFLQGRYYKTWHFGGSLGIVIEGIGNLCNPLWPAHPETFMAGCQVQCYSSVNGTPLCLPSYPLSYQPPPYSGPALVPNFDNNLSCSGLAVSAPSIHSNAVRICPNPGSTSMIMKITQLIERGTLTVYNATGQMIVSRTLQHVSDVPVGQLLAQPGLYYYHITDETNKWSGSGKLVIL